MTIDPELEGRLAWLEAAVAKVARDVTPPVTLPPRPGADATRVSPEVLELSRAGRTIDAIRLQREQTGADLAEAKRAVENTDLT
jgi:ribosomal protein L7/L12